MSSDKYRDVARDPQDIARLFVRYGNERDVEGMASCYEDGAVLAIDKERTALGRSAIKDFYTTLLATGRTFTLGEQQPAVRMYDLALTSTYLPDGRVTVEVARLQSDGTWLWILDQPALARVQS